MSARWPRLIGRRLDCQRRPLRRHRCRAVETPPTARRSRASPAAAAPISTPPSPPPAPPPRATGAGRPAAERGRVLAAPRPAGRWSAPTSSRASRRSDVGKPLTQASADARALARYLEFYGGAADKLTGETIPYLAGYTVFTLREPHGVTGHIIPWNYPMQIVGRSVGAALAAGNACVLKPAEEACLTALAFAALAAEAGLPPGALNVVPGLGEEAGAALAAHPGIDHISFTGSRRGRPPVQAAAAENVVPVTLELGGKSPQLVFADADLDAALPLLVNAGIQNAGQTCSAASRILVQRGIYDGWSPRWPRATTRSRVGPALDDLDLGPLISAARRQSSRASSTAPATGRVAGRGTHRRRRPRAAATTSRRAPRRRAARPPAGPGGDLRPRAGRDPLRRTRTRPSRSPTAPTTAWSPASGPATAPAQLRLARRLRAGQVFINNYGAGGGVELPFGGVGQSGHGREKGFEALLASPA